MALPKQHRLGSSRDFNRVHRRGVRAATEHLAVRALRLKNQAQPVSKPVLRSVAEPAVNTETKIDRVSLPEDVVRPRVGLVAKSPLQEGKMFNRAGDPSMPASSFGISISRKVSKRAVVRNRIKRQIKSIIRQYLPNIAPGWQVVIVVRPAAVECEFGDFLRELEKIFRKLKILNLK